MLAAVRAVLQPLAHLLVARGMTFATAEESLKMAFVNAAREAHPGGLPHRLVSRISTTTGINRREVTRLTREAQGLPGPHRSLANELHVHWLTAPAYRDGTGTPMALPRQGPKPSFDTLAREVTNDVHPRSLLDEMVRLGYAQIDTAADRVSVVAEATTPKGDRPRLFEILGHNVGDHLSAAVANVLTDSTAHFEQAIIADGIDQEAVRQVDALLRAQWRLLLDALVPALQELVARHDASGAADSARRLTIGLYEFNAPVRASPPPPKPSEES